MTHEYPWYEIVEETGELEQGDFIDDFEVLVTTYIPNETEADMPTYRAKGISSKYNLVIVSQSCDLENGMLLIDEFENGIYYTLQPDLWHLIFQVARRLNVQVFATTHSWDCIEGFQKAAQADEQNEGMLIRLEYKKGEVAVTLFDERQLGIATRERIEVR